MQQILFRFPRYPFLVLTVLLTLSCSRGGSSSAPAPETSAVNGKTRDELCPRDQTSKDLNSSGPIEAGSAATMTFTDLRARLSTACATCHQAPAKSGGFSYIDTFKGTDTTVGGVTAFYPGWKEAAERAVKAMLSADESSRMPPAHIRNKNPDSFKSLGEILQTWIDVGQPEGTFALRASGDSSVKPPLNSNPAGLQSDCIPKPELIGSDYPSDRKFAALSRLPSTLAETDLVSLDAFELAKRGTVTYSVEYPLWADNAEKGRLVHVPMKIVDKTLVRQPIVYDPRRAKFEVADNTRFYKTFYRKLKTKAGVTRFRKMETRLIVVRTPWANSLFGTYQWNEAETSARLIETPYRDGSAFKDTLTTFTIDELSGQTRKYAIPGRQRCLDCHMGSENQNFVLGFTPLQVHRREKGQGGSSLAPSASELTQVERLKSYGILERVGPPDALPILEWQGDFEPRNAHELRAQAYLVGNCAHCHNANGLAFTKENGITLAFTPGAIFKFNTQTRSSEMPTRKIVHQSGDPLQSQIYMKVANPSSQQGMFSQMPMHSPGLPNCDSLKLLGKWIRSFESDAAAESWGPDCKPSEDFEWIDQDFTWPNAESYTPRRADWDDPANGMPEKFRALRLTPVIEAAVNKKYAVGYWSTKPICSFPAVDLPAQAQRPWMLKDGTPKRPFGEIYATTPGSWFYRTTCMKCHGGQADGNSSLAKGILNWSGGSVRVANLADGIFGNSGLNKKVFDRGDRNLAGNYLIWMAMQGTRVKFPPELSSYLGPHGGQMLNLLREKCRNQISSEKTSSPNFPDHEMFHEICFSENRFAGDPVLKYDPSTNRPMNATAVEDWLDRGAENAGWAIFQFLTESSQGRKLPGNDECEKLYPK